ncbi:hypothetical protein QBC41DRAFT_67416 [Cercophora samala]|uniref:Uncharacterized protein n=1 Tax=Cercophora samala TaxID=330535 RepID=A0AA39ZGP4_9PEZI|nr:hypothetical protein QBC41DRAFT_67416 [Cercophora samala]
MALLHRKSRRATENGVSGRPAGAQETALTPKCAGHSTRIATPMSQLIKWNTFANQRWTRNDEDSICEQPSALSFFDPAGRGRGRGGFAAFTDRGSQGVQFYVFSPRIQLSTNSIGHERIIIRSLPVEKCSIISMSLGLLPNFRVINIILTGNFSFAHHLLVSRRIGATLYFVWTQPCGTYHCATGGGPFLHATHHPPSHPTHLIQSLETRPVSAQAGFHAAS